VKSEAGLSVVVVACAQRVRVKLRECNLLQTAYLHLRACVKTRHGFHISLPVYRHVYRNTSGHLTFISNEPRSVPCSGRTRYQSGHPYPATRCSDTPHREPRELDPFNAHCRRLRPAVYHTEATVKEGYPAVAEQRVIEETKQLENPPVVHAGQPTSPADQEAGPAARTKSLTEGTSRRTPREY